MDKILKLFGGNEQLWQYIQKYAKTAGIEATKTVLELYYVLKSPDTPMPDKTIIVAALAYQLLPEDLINTEDYGLLGLLDNVAALALAYNRVKARVTPHIKTQVNAVLSQWFEEPHPALSGVDIDNNNSSQTTVLGEQWQPETMQTPINYETGQQERTRKPSSQLWNEDDVVID